MGAAGAGSEVMKYSMAAVFMFCQLVAGDGFRYFNWYLRSLQIALHYPMMHIIVPANVSAFFEGLLPIIQFDILDPEWTTELWFKFNDEL